MASFLRVRNLGKYQHYRDRNPPWIKLHREMLEDYEFGNLPDAIKGHAVMMLLLAARLGNVLPYDPPWISKKINANRELDLAILLEIGFLETCDAEGKPCASDLLAPCKQLDPIEGEERERRVRGKGEETTLPNMKPLGEVDFDLLWSVCAKKVGKARALKAYKRLRKAGGMPPVAVLVDALHKLQQTEQWTKQGRQYQPHLESWLNRGGWDDELPKSNGAAAAPATSGTRSSYQISDETRARLAERHRKAVEESRRDLEQPDSTMPH